MNIEQLELTDELIPAVPPYAHLGHFNRVQSTLLRGRVPGTASNLILGTRTSTGKTISAELFIHFELNKGGKVVYAAPMKALVDEKFGEWHEMFCGYKIAILTGDFRGKASSSEEALVNADIIVMTTEMLDSQTRGASRVSRDRPHWMSAVTLCILDEGHIIGSKDRGVPGELGITRLALVSPNARFVILSATLPNITDFASWVHDLNGLKTYVLNSPWRPVTLEWKLVPITSGRFAQARNEMRVKATRLISSKSEEKFLVFVHEKKTGHDLIKDLSDVGIDAEFHRADLKRDERTAIENGFRQKKGGLRVLVSTSTLAWGVNLPARNVIIIGVSRGLNKVDVADIIQMAGRAGRMGIDDKGTCYLMCPSSETKIWTQQVNDSPPVLSALLDEMHLRFQLLSEIANGIVVDQESLPAWFSRTLAGHQVGYQQVLMEKAVQRLVSMKMLRLREDGTFEVTPMGHISASLYIKPDDVYHWYMTMLGNGSIDTDTQIAVLLSAPTVSLKYVPTDFKGVVGLFEREADKEKTKHSVVFPFTPYAIWSHLKGDTHGNNSLDFYVRPIVEDIDRTTTALEMLSRLMNIPVSSDIGLRIKYGVPKQVAFLCGIPDIGAKRAFLLYKAGLSSADKVRRATLDQFIASLGKRLGTNVYEYIAEYGDQL